MIKYSEEKYIDALLNMGSIRIGTLYDFRNIEHKKGIADEEEGKKLLTYHINKTQYPSKDSIHIRALNELGNASFAEGHNPNNEFIIENVKVINQLEVPDCYVMCFSSSLSRDTLREFEGANSALIVLKLHEFFKEITKQLNFISSVKFIGVRRVQYQPRREIWNGINHGISPVSIKSLAYAKQYELRAIWESTESYSIRPIILSSYILGSYCKKVKI